MHENKLKNKVRWPATLLKESEFQHFTSKTFKPYYTGIQAKSKWTSSLMACCKSSEILLYEAPNTKSRCIPDRAERDTGKEMEVETEYWGKARRIKGNVVCREKLFHQYLWQVPKQFKAGIRATKCRVHWNNISPGGFVWSWKRSFFSLFFPDFSAFTSSVKTDAVVFLARCDTLGGPTREEARVVSVCGWLQVLSELG